MKDCDLVVVGAGPGGLAAGLYGARLGIDTMLIGESLGGMAAEAWLVENYPGFESIKGIDLVEKMRKQAEGAGLKMRFPERVDSLELDGEEITVRMHDEELRTIAVVIATGCCHRTLGAPGEDEFRGRGVSYCAVCDGVFFKGRDVAVIGGGNSAAMEALYLRDLARKVYLVHRRGSLRADAAMRRQLDAAGVEFVWHKTVKEIQGENLVESVLLCDTRTGEESSLAVSGTFIAVGESPQSQLAKGIGVDLTPEGFIDVNRRQETSVKGVYAAGDVTGGVHQIGVAVGEGITAGIQAYLYITGGWYGESKKR
jgi:thioredoxin reductase (NADPH)